MGLLFVCLFVLSRYPLYTEPSLLTSLLCLGKPVRNDSLGSPGTPAAVIPNPTDASVSCLTAFVSHQPNCTSPLTLYFAPVSCNSSEPEFNALYSLRRSEGQWRQPGSTSHRRGGVEMVLKSDCLLTLSEEGLSGDSGSMNDSGRTLLILFDEPGMHQISL